MAFEIEAIDTLDLKVRAFACGIDNETVLWEKPSAA